MAKFSIKLIFFRIGLICCILMCTFFFLAEECLGLDTLKNALKLFESWKILTYRVQNSQKLYTLRQYYNDAFKLKDIIDRIAKYTS